MELLLNHALTAVEKDGLLMTCTDSEEPKQERMAVDEVVIAVGRKPNMDLYHEMGPPLNGWCRPATALLAAVFWKRPAQEMTTCGSCESLMTGIGGF